MQFLVCPSHLNKWFKNNLKMKKTHISRCACTHTQMQKIFFSSILNTCKKKYRFLSWNFDELMILELKSQPPLPMFFPIFMRMWVTHVSGAPVLSPQTTRQRCIPTLTLFKCRFGWEIRNPFKENSSLSESIFLRLNSLII